MLEVIGDSGPAVLLLPGGGEAVDGFYPGLVEGLIADPGCRVILYDRPGTMGSDVAGTLADASDAIHTMLAELGLGPVVVIGQSLGGAVAMLLALDHPEDVAGLVLLDPTPINDPKLAKQAEQTARTTASLSKVPGFGWALSALLRSIAERSAKRHDMSPAARAATLKIAEVDLVKLSESAAGLEAIALSFDESQLPVRPGCGGDRGPQGGIDHHRGASASGDRARHAAAVVAGRRASGPSDPPGRGAGGIPRRRRAR